MEIMKIMKKIISVILVGIPYIIKWYQIAKKVKTQLDFNHDGKTTTDELAKFLKDGDLDISFKEVK